MKDRLESSLYFINTDIKFDVNEIWWDSYLNRDNDLHTAVIGCYVITPEGEREPVELWRREDYRSQKRAINGQEAAHRRLITKAESWSSHETGRTYG